jgi:hypothetical protein
MKRQRGYPEKKPWGPGHAKTEAMHFEIIAVPVGLRGKL